MQHGDREDGLNYGHGSTNATTRPALRDQTAGSIIAPVRSAPTNVAVIQSRDRNSTDMVALLTSTLSHRQFLPGHESRRADKLVDRLLSGLDLL